MTAACDRLPRPVEPVESAMDSALDAMGNGKALSRRRIIRETAHSYRREMLVGFIAFPAEWLAPHNDGRVFVDHEIQRRLRVAINYARSEASRHTCKLRAPYDRETRLWGFLGGELLLRGRNIQRPEDV